MEGLLGTVIHGKYLLRSVLGKGGMGVVYRAAQLDAGGDAVRDVAVKMILPELARSDPNLAKRFVREVRAAARLRGPYTITVHDFGQWGDSELYYVMELVEGPTLKQVIRAHGRLPIDAAISIGRQICEALHEAHGLPQPVVHRDLKPANVFIERWPQAIWVRVGDFGIAKLLGEESTGLTGDDSYLGTPIYMAPEQCSAGGTIDTRTDLYALGVMLYEMVSGKPPFGGEYMSVMYQHIHEAPPMLDDTVPAKLRMLIARLLAKKPEDRPNDAAQVEKELERVTVELPSPRDFSTREARHPSHGGGDEPSPLRREDASNLRPATDSADSKEGSTAETSKWWIAVGGVFGGILIALALSLLGVLDGKVLPDGNAPPAPLQKAASPLTRQDGSQLATDSAGTERDRAPSMAAGYARIAVLEFRNERPDDAEHNWIRTALQTSFSTELNKLRDLLVYSREVLPEGSGSLEAVRSLGATELITGSFAILGDVIRVDARLVDVATGMQEGAESVEGNLQEFFSLQKRLALSILEHLPVEVAEADRKAIANKNASENQGRALDAYRLMLQGEGLDEEPSGEATDAGPRAESEPSSSVILSDMVVSLIHQLSPAAAPAEERNGAQQEIIEVLEEYRAALEKGDLDGIQRTRGFLSERRRQGLEQYFKMAEGLRVEFDDVHIEQVDNDRFNVSYVRRDFFADRRTGENVSLEVQLQNAAVRKGEFWRIENRKALTAE